MWRILLIKVINVRLGINMRWRRTLSVRAFIQFFENSRPLFSPRSRLEGMQLFICLWEWYVVLHTRETRSHLLRVNLFDLPSCTVRVTSHFSFTSFRLFLSTRFDLHDHRAASTIRDPTWRSIERSSLERNLGKLRNNVRPGFPSRQWLSFISVYTNLQTIKNLRNHR